jgi:hypothetical protein
MKFVLSKKIAIASVVLLAVLLNFAAFCYAYPETFQIEYANLARDFSAYYIGGWRLIHNPTQVYVDAVLPGDYPIGALQQPFKYTPNFLILFEPFMSLSYQDALSVFNIVQFLSILALGFFVFKLIENKNLFLATVVALIVIVNPLLFSPSIAYSIPSYMRARIFTLHMQTFSPSYYTGYLLVNAHVLQTTLLVGALYFGFAKKPWLSAFVFAFAAFDPRAALIAVPLLLWYNRRSLVKFIGGCAVFFAATNLPFFFYYGVGFQFLDAVTHASVVGQMYLYDWLPLIAVGALTAGELVTVLLNRRGQLNSKFFKKGS